MHNFLVTIGDYHYTILAWNLRSISFTKIFHFRYESQRGSHTVVSSATYQLFVSKCSSCPKFLQISAKLTLRLLPTGMDIQSEFTREFFGGHEYSYLMLELHQLVSNSLRLLCSFSGPKDLFRPLETFLTGKYRQDMTISAHFIQVSTKNHL